MTERTIAGQREAECSGCEACAAVCPEKCITFEQNTRGFFMPVIDREVCIHCGKCRKVCPEINPPELQPVENVWAAAAKQTEKIICSTSGGIFGLLAETVLRQQGVVYGCAWETDFRGAGIIRVDQAEDLDRIRQSKYLQARMDHVYELVRKDLAEGKYVLFSGTGCQLAGLRNALGERTEHMITVEVACHGVPSPGLFEKYLDWQENRLGSSVSGFRFRTRDHHQQGEHYRFCMELEEGRKIYPFAWSDPYYGSFLQGRTLRETCYHCNFKQEQRVGDILLSDYWGIEKECPAFPAQRGVSGVTVNSSRGQALFEKIRPDLILQESSYPQLTAHNRSLTASAACEEAKRLKTIEKDADELFRELKPEPDFKRSLKNIVPEKLKYHLKRL